MIGELYGELVSDCRASASRVKNVLPESPSVAIIEDDAAIIRAHTRLISPLASVSAYSEARLFVEALKTRPFDLVLTDKIGLPFVPEIKRLAPDLQIVVISGSDAPPQLPEGVSLWITKPVPVETLYALVERELDVFGLTLVS